MRPQIFFISKGNDQLRPDDRKLIFALKNIFFSENQIEAMEKVSAEKVPPSTPCSNSVVLRPM